MKLLLAILIAVVLLLVLTAGADAEGWVLDLKLHTYADFMEMSQRLTKDIGGVNLLLTARQFKVGEEQINSLNFGLRGSWYGVEYLTGENITPEMRAFSLFSPLTQKAETLNTPCDSILHTYLQQEFDGGFVKFDWYKRGDTSDEMVLNARTEF